MLINTFSDQLLLENKFFSVQMLLRRSYFFRISNCLEHVLFRGRKFCQTATFSEEEHVLEQHGDIILINILVLYLHSSRYSLRTVTLSERLVLCDQLHSISTWKGFPLTITCSFKYTRNYELVWRWNSSILYCQKEQDMY